VFMLHHLNGADEKVRTLREIRRVLKPGGRLHLLDFSQPEANKAGVIAGWMHRHHRLEDNTDARVRSFMDDADERWIGADVVDGADIRVVQR
jgi:ubiquinone/menaquinone biosynthesis C-methylase UbiE